MSKNMRFGWIAEAEARRFAEAALTQHGLSEPQFGVVEAAPTEAQGHWVRRLIARVASTGKLPKSTDTINQSGEAEHGEQMKGRRNTAD
jgi:hypothetical protein